MLKKITKIFIATIAITGFAVSFSANGSETFEYNTFKTISLPSFPGMTVPVYKSQGTNGPGILMVHGNSSSSRSYVYQMFLSLGQHYKIFLVDLPGHGNASKVDSSIPFPYQPNGLPLGFPQYQFGLVEAVAAVANDVDVQAQVFVGWSLGGDVLLLAQGSGVLPNAKGFFIFGTAPTGANAPSSEKPFLDPEVPGVPGLSILPSFGFSFQPDPTSPIGFNLNGLFADPVPAYAPAPISAAPSKGDAYVRAFFNENRRLSGNVPQFFLEDAKQKSDDRFRSSLGVIGLGLYPAGGPIALPDELAVLQSLQGDPNNPNDDIPIAVAVGKQEAFINVNYLKALKANGFLPTLWKDKIIEVPFAGHAIHFERPYKFNLMIHQFVNDL